MNMIIKLAVKYLTSRLRKDKDLYRAYQANIAMAMYDAFRRNTNMENSELHKVCNEGATDFINLWTKDSE